MRPQHTKPNKAPVRSEATNEQGYPQSLAIGGNLLGFQFVAPITRDGVYKGTNSKGEEVSAIVCHPDAAANQLAYFDRAS